MNKVHFNNYGKIIALIGFVIMLPLLIIPFDLSQVKYAYLFYLPGLISVFIGVVVCLFVKSAKTSDFFDDERKKSTKIVVFTWFYCFFLGAIPYYLYGNLTFLQALFESVSGYTTTGLSVISVAETPKILLFHRTLTQYIGGFGLILMLTTLIRDAGSTNLYSAEGHDKILPNVQKTARLVFVTYNTLILIGAVGFYIFGMNAFDALCHSICSLFTGGFSTVPNGIAEYNSNLISLWAIFLMFLGCINTGVLLLLSSGKFKQAFKISEFRFLLVVILFFCILSTSILYIQDNNSLSDAFMNSCFNVVSAISTCGNYYCDLSVAHPVLIGIVIMCMVFGGCAGSTTGGIKLSRILLLLKVMWNTLIEKVSSSMHVSNIQQTNINGIQIIDDNDIRSTFSFIGYYLILLCAGTVAIMVSCQCNVWQALFEFASSLGGVGLSCGLTGPFTNAATLIIEMVGMILGRLEIYIFVISIYYFISDIKRLFNK